ncbi:MAG: thioredoxin domain-containing protein [Planctomycetes bacterium]|nr:thioredoxin domain-containing protein [Planctomycetota bacterium]
MNDTPKHTNRLAKESSPYLRQHAHNPVDWWPWCDEAFAKAKKEDKPIFLSIGYSTCHWCHVMERESFEDEGIAELLNERYISIKVDREERPDVDAVYMAAVQATSGQGGWPLTVFLTHDRKPFFGGTYFPPEDRWGRAGFPTVLKRLDEVWRTKRADVVASSEGIADAVRRGGDTLKGGDLSTDPLDHAVEQFRATFDDQQGGYGPPPKFPRAFALSFLLERSAGPGRARDEAALAQIERTLDAMQRGGIHDHVGGGFHRYSTDREWLVPHFEKMLYDQATLIRAYTDAWLVSRDPRWEATARDAIAYVLRDLRDPTGGFLSAEDADSEGVEGKFYVWTENEIAAILGPDDAALCRRVYETEPGGNFIDEAQHTRTGANILHVRTALAEHAAAEKTTVVALSTRLAAMRAKLLAVRSKRVRPHLDDKVLADWNGLMIGALARAATAFGDETYAKEAARAADFVLATMREADGHLLHRWRKGDAAIPAFLEDHAFLAIGLADLYEATFDAKYLAAARDLCREIVTEFRDPDGAFRLASRRGEKQIASTRELYDGALPSGNSAAAYALVRVGSATGDEALTKAGADCLSAWMPTLTKYPMGYPYALSALAWALGPTREVVIAGAPDDAATKALIAEVRSRFLPETVVLVHAPGAAGNAIEAVAPFTASQNPVAGKPAAYVCRNRSCAAPVTTPEALAKLLEAQ